MESERTLRFVIAPGLLLAWIAVGKLFAGGQDDLVTLLGDGDDVGKAIMVVATGGAILTVSGYVMSLITVVIFHVLKIVCLRIEVPLRKTTIERMRDRLMKKERDRTNVPVRNFSRLAVVVTYQARFWDKQAITWAERRWMNIGICANGVLAVIGALILGHNLCDIPFTPWWVWLSVALIVLFLFQLVMTACELSRMHYVASWIDPPKKDEKAEEKEDDEKKKTS